MPETSQGEAPTGGEWVVATESVNPHWRGDGTEVLSEYGRIAETHVGGLRDPAECRANARLIAAAPDLLEAAREALGELYRVSPSRAAPMIRAAIAKATQSQQQASTEKP